MSAEQASQTQTPEIPQEAQLIHWSSNFHTQKARAGILYTEAAIFSNPDGGMQLNLASAGIGNPPTTLPPIESVVTGEAAMTFEDHLFSDAMLLEQSYTRNDTACKALKKLGYDYSQDTHDGVDFFESVIPSTERLNIVMAYLREKTDFAPNYKDYPGGHFPADLMAEEQDKNNVLIATEPLNRSHDLAAHMFVWAIVPEEAFKTTAARGTTLLHAYKKAVASGNEEEIKPAKTELDTHYNDLEEYIFKRTFESVADIANDDNISKVQDGTASQPVKEAVKSLERALGIIMYGNNASPEQQENANGLVLEMPKRLQIIAEMPEEYIEQALDLAA
jgi:hypothetical protein